MKFPNPISLLEVAEILNCEFVGDSNFEIFGLNEIHRVEKGDIVFVDHPKYYDKALNSAATTILINKKVDCPEGKSLLISEDPFRDFVKIGQKFMSFQVNNQNISDSAIIGKGTVIQAGAIIGNDVKIGENCIIHSNVSVNDYTEIGDNVIIHSGTVLGADAFYYKKRDWGFDKLKSVGNVVIEDDVEIGANCTIDRGVTASTIIGKGSKLDNLIQVGHDTKIGERCLVASQVGIAGCCIIEDEVTLWGQVGIASGLTIGKGAVVLAQSGIGKNLEAGKSYLGSPADEARTQFKKIAILNRLEKG